VNSNTYAVYGHGQEKDLTELVPNILSQLGPESMDSLKRLAEQVGAGRGGQKEQEPDDDDVPVRSCTSAKSRVYH
jgi:nascent polypeptide-associated complex subunit beta